jgi:hypothetical protein
MFGHFSENLVTRPTQQNLIVLHSLNDPTWRTFPSFICIRRLQQHQNGRKVWKMVRVNCLPPKIQSAKKFSTLAAAAAAVIVAREFGSGREENQVFMAFLSPVLTHRVNKYVSNK